MPADGWWCTCTTGLSGPTYCCGLAGFRAQGCLLGRGASLSSRYRSRVSCVWCFGALGLGSPKPLIQSKTLASVWCCLTLVSQKPFWEWFYRPQLVGGAVWGRGLTLVSQKPFWEWFYRPQLVYGAVFHKIQPYRPVICWVVASGPESPKPFWGWFLAPVDLLQKGLGYVPTGSQTVPEHGLAWIRVNSCEKSFLLSFGAWIRVNSVIPETPVPRVHT